MTSSARIVLIKSACEIRDNGEAWNEAWENDSMQKVRREMYISVTVYPEMDNSPLCPLRITTLTM